MRKMISVCVGILAILALAIPVQAQSRSVYQYDRSSPYYNGGYSDGGVVRCQYDRNGRPYNCRRYDRNGRSQVGPFIAGAVVGGVVGAVVASRNRNQATRVQQEMPVPMAQPQPAVQRVPYEEPVETVVPRSQPTPVAGPAANGGEGQFELSNATRVYVEAYDGDTYIGRMAPGATLAVGPPQDRYRGFALVPQPDGRLGKDELGREVAPGGWTFIEPKMAQGGK